MRVVVAVAAWIWLVALQSTIGSRSKQMLCAWHETKNPRHIYAVEHDHLQSLCNCLGAIRPPMQLRLRGGASENGSRNDEHKGRKRKRKRPKKDIFTPENSRPKIHVPLSARLKRLRGEVKDMKRGDDTEAWFTPETHTGEQGGKESGDREPWTGGQGSLGHGDSRRYVTWKEKAKRQKQAAFYRKVKIERQRLSATNLAHRQGALEEQVGFCPVPTVGGIMLQEVFGTTDKRDQVDPPPTGASRYINIMREREREMESTEDAHTEKDGGWRGGVSRSGEVTVE